MIVRRRTGVARPRLPCGLGILLGAVLAARGAAAQPQPIASGSAQKLFDEGRRLMADKQFALACQRFTASKALEAGIGVSLWLADCFESNGQVASAYNEFVATAELAAERGDPRASIARGRAEALHARLSRVVLATPEALPDTVEVDCDGVAIPRTRWLSGQYVDPGLHHLRARDAGRAFWEADLVVDASGEVKTASIPLPLGVGAAAPSSPPGAAEGPPSPPAGSPAGGRTRTRTAIALTSAGVGLAGIGLGIAFGLEAKSHNDSAACGPMFCSNGGHALRLEALHEATAADVAFAVGGAALVAGVVVYFLRVGGSDRAPARAASALLGYPVAF